MAKRDSTERDVEYEVMTPKEVDALKALSSISTSLDKIAISLHTISDRLAKIEDRERQIASLLLKIAQNTDTMRSQGLLDTLALSLMEKMRGNR